MLKIAMLVLVLAGVVEVVNYVFDTTGDRATLLRGRLGLVWVVLGVAGLAWVSM